MPVRQPSTATAQNGQGLHGGAKRRTIPREALLEDGGKTMPTGTVGKHGSLHNLALDLESPRRVEPLRQRVAERGGGCQETPATCQCSKLGAWRECESKSYLGYHDCRRGPYHLIGAKAKGRVRVNSVGTRVIALPTSSQRVPRVSLAVHRGPCTCSWLFPCGNRRVGYSHKAISQGASAGAGQS